MRLFAVLVLAGALGCSASSAGAATLPVDVRVVAGVEDPPDGSYIVRGSVAGKGLRGAVVYRKTFGAPTSQGTFTFYGDDGTLAGTSETTTTGFDGVTSAFTERMVVTRGTGRYRGARGELTGSGQANVNSGFVTEQLRGELTLDPVVAPAPKPEPRQRPFTATMRGTPAAFADNVATVVGSVRGLTPAGGMMVLISPQTTIATITFTYYDGRGSLRGRVPIRRRRSAGGRMTVTPRGAPTLTGTGAYRRARRSGRFTVSGGPDPRTGIVTLRLSGAFRY